jgi:tetratricopeptide (TPR) repeat protein
LDAAVARAPDDPRPRRRLAALLCEAGRDDEALGLAQRRVAAAPDDGEAWLDLGGLLQRAGRHAAAADAFERVRAPALQAAALAGRGTALRRLGRTAEALPLLAAAQALDPEDALAARGVGACLAALADGAGLEAHSRRAIAGFGGPSWAISQLAIALALQARSRELAELLDYDRLIAVRELDVPAGWASPTTFNAALAAELRGERFEWIGAEARRDTVVREARFARREALAPLADGAGGPVSALAQLERAFKIAADRYRDEARAAPGHPHALGRPRSAVVQYVAHILRGNGHIAPHTHPYAWINAVYYVETPHAVSGSSTGAGWLWFAPPPHPDPRVAANWPVRRIEPRAGRLVIFPSFSSHHVTPVECAEARIAVAFEVEAARPEA